MKLTPGQIGIAQRLQRNGLLLREIAAKMGVPYETICLALYGDNAEWPAILDETPEPQTGVPAAQTAMPDGASSIAPHCGSSPAESESVAISAPIPPETASEMVGGFPVPAAPYSREGTGGPDQADTKINMNADVQGVTGGESAATSSLGEEDAGKPAGASAPAAPGLYRLRNELGEYLHEHERGMTRLPKFFWRGTEAQVVSLFKRRPHFKDLDLEPATVSTR